MYSFQPVANTGQNVSVHISLERVYGDAFYFPFAGECQIKGVVPAHYVSFEVRCISWEITFSEICFSRGKMKLSALYSSCLKFRKINIHNSILSF